MEAFTQLPEAFFHFAVADVVLQGIDQLDIADGSGQLANQAGYTFSLPLPPTPTGQLGEGLSQGR
jgi:hypothetical protein